MSTVESWFIPFDIILVVSTGFAGLSGVIFVLIIIFDKICHTVPMLLVANTSLTAILFGFSMFSLAMFTLQSDLRQVQTYDVFCIVRSYIAYGACAIFNFSFTLQAFYRYLLITYPNRLLYQSARFQLQLILLTWMYGFIVPIEFVARGEVVYSGDNQICQIPLGLSFSIIYMASCVYVFPIFLTMIIYYKVIRYVKQMNARTTSVNTVLRARYELKMVRRIIIIIVILLALGLTYFIFILMSFFTTPPKYHFRIAFMFLDVSMAGVMLVVFKFTDHLRSFMKTRRNMEQGTVAVIWIGS
ncbi:unnamed protein product [Adineta ricciae]|uniref:G-protein coupled receptors family 1 profile domain-containing protein n=1 Tax=Adineta ricciae TaxID=249248 RepID=A0A814JGZ9_ADIRI|nr:unnamed protein product [Adineta ricciae]CAF1037489.1 unnamed protein product [Adineta ricciae]